MYFDTVGVFSQRQHPRLRYILQVVLEAHLGLRWELFHNWEAFKQYESPKWSYGPTPERLPELPATPAVDWLCAGERPPAPEVCAAPVLQLRWQGRFDILAACFYQLVRCEEYGATNLDIHSRFPASASLAVREGFLHRPVVQEWAAQLGRWLVAQYPRLRTTTPAFRFLPTYDIDMAWAYRARGWRAPIGLARDVLRGQPARVVERVRVWTGTKEDPFDTFEFLSELHRTYQLAPLFFWLVGDRNRFDPNPSHQHKLMKRLVSDVAAEHQIGLHPSYRGFNDVNRVEMERKRLEALCGRSVSDSRQHYLRLTFPDTYRVLLEAGLTADFSMGFADHWGYRAGTALPYRWYDLERESATELLIHPFLVMDRTLKDYLALKPAEAAPVLLQILETVREWGGPLRTLWHNSSFASSHGWAGWQQLYQRFVHQASI